MPRVRAMDSPAGAGEDGNYWRLLASVGATGYPPAGAGEEPEDRPAAVGDEGGARYILATAAEPRRAHTWDERMASFRV